MNKDTSKNEINSELEKENMNSGYSDNSDDSPLAVMGVSNPSQIIRYSLHHEEKKDVLKIYYRRKKGSLLPASRKYKFGRSIRTIVTDSGKPEYGETYDISTFLLEAIKELDNIVIQSEDTSDRKKAIIKEINQLEKTFSNRLNEIRDQVEML